LPGVTYGIHYQAALEAAGKGKRSYASSASAGLSLKAGPAPASRPADTVKTNAELVLTIDSLAFGGADRDPGEDRYMVERLRKYRARLLLTRTGQILALEEEPALPPVELSTLNFGRWLLYCLPAFPTETIGDGSQWTAEQPLLDKFHPDSKVVKTYTATALRKSEAGRILKLKVEMSVLLEDLGDESAAKGPALTGQGEVLFNLDKGLPVSMELTLQGNFRTPKAPGSDSAAPASKPLRLKEYLLLRFSP
jgi:hypothetical protein